MKTKSKAKMKPNRVRLTKSQIEIVGQFNDYSFENMNLSFKETVRKQFKTNPFPRTPQGRLFEKECREIFDREREK